MSSSSLDVWFFHIGFWATWKNGFDWCGCKICSPCSPDFGDPSYSLYSSLFFLLQVNLWNVDCNYAELIFSLVSQETKINRIEGKQVSLLRSLWFKRLVNIYLIVFFKLLLYDEYNNPVFLSNALGSNKWRSKAIVRLCLELRKWKNSRTCSGVFWTFYVEYLNAAILFSISGGLVIQLF